MPFPRRPWQLLFTMSLLVELAGCNLSLRPSSPLPDGGAVPAIANNGVGTACTADAACRTGLICAPATKTCQPPGNRPAGGACTLSAECMPGQSCTPDGICAQRGSGELGAACKLEGDCAAGICDYQGLSGTCAPAGTVDLGGACTKATDCLGGLICSLGKCQTFETIEPWQGAVCPDSTAMAPKALFKVPRPGETSEDFYSLPFPNDVRKSEGKLSLAGHPTPGSRYLPFDPVKNYFALVEQDLTGYGLNPGIFFRFSRAPSVGSVRAPGVVSLVNITPGSPEYGKTHAILSPELRTGKSFYVCAPYLIVHSKWGEPLRAGETYAALVRRGVVDDMSMPFEPDDDFAAMLSGTPASGPLAIAWVAYAPLRAWMSDQKVPSDSLLSAAVFTTQPIEDTIVGLRKAVREGPAPEIKGMVKCGDPAVVSPCDDGKPGDQHVRGCSPPSASFDEYQGTIAIPVFQGGTKPYEKEGGGIQLDASGKAVAVGSEDVCFTLTVPRGVAPAAGWPVVVYAHGTGGSYRSVVDQGLSAEYAKGDLPDGAGQPMATLGYDGALHANRRGGSQRSPDELVYNFVNARAARDNGLQAAADLFVVARALEGFAAVKVDATKLVLYGHSQGGNAAALAAPFEPLYGTTVLSGTGGTLTYSLLAKKKPVDIAAGVPLLLGDPKVDELHPILNVLQMYFERSDAVNFGRRLFREPPAGVPARSVLHVYGAADTYAPPLTQQTYARSAGFPVLSPAVEEFGLMKVSGPVKGNVMVVGGSITALEAQFMPSGGDGHFVSTQHPVARRLVQQMLGTFVRDGQPTVGP